MARLKSVRLSARRFCEELTRLRTFVTSASFSESPDTYTTWLFEYGVIRLYREFEKLMLDALVGAINHDTSVLSRKLGFEFPKRLTDEVCEYLVTGGGYFDFKGRDGLIAAMKEFVPDDHYLVQIVSKPRYREALERLSALRNFSSHDSDQAKRRALAATNMRRMAGAGVWLKTQNRFVNMLERLEELAREMERTAPH